MTRIDRFERDLPAALADLADEPVPDYFIDIVGQTARTRQRPAWAIPGRWFQMQSLATRPALAALGVAGLIIAIGGGMLLSRNDPGVGGPSAAPSATPLPSPSASATPAPNPLPTEVLGGWSAPSRGTAFEDPIATTIVFRTDLDRLNPAFELARPSGDYALGSDAVQLEPGIIRIGPGTGTNAGCPVSDLGTYRWSRSADGQWLTLDLIEDACRVRADIMAGTWQRNLGFRNDGGPGVMTAFEPFMSLTLPALAFTGSEYGMSDTVSVNWASPNRDEITYQVWKDLDAFVDPCDADKGRRILIGMDGFLAYLNEDPRFRVTRQEETTIDGRRAAIVEFEIGADIKAPCWTFDGNAADRTGVLTWVPNSWQGGFWNAPIGSQDLLAVTEVDGSSLVFEFVKSTDGVNTVDRSVLDSIRFLDALPTPPAP